MVEIVPATYRHIGRIANRMREIDAEECRAMGRAPKEALRAALLTADQAWTVLVDGVPEAMFGVTTESALTREAVPWFLGTNAVYRHGRLLLTWGPLWLRRLGDSTMSLRNLVSARNDRAIRLLRRWGFTVGDSEVIVRGVPFLHFKKAPV